MESVSFAAIEENCTGGLVKEVFDYSDKIGTDVVLLHGCPQSCMPNAIEGLLEVCEDFIEILHVLEMFLTKASLVESVVLLPALKPACSLA